MEDDVARYQQMFLAAEEASQTSRQNAERDRDYYDGKQLTAQERKALADRGQPPVVVNLIKGVVNYLTGLEKQQRSDPKAYPRNPMSDAEAAEAATDGLRYVVENANYDVSRSATWRQVLVEGVAGVQVMVVDGRDGPEIDIESVDFDRFFADPHSRKIDYSDANYLGLVIWQDLDDAVQQYGEEHRDSLTDLVKSVSATDTYDDSPKHTMWADPARKRVRVVQLWHRKADGWHFCEFSGGVKLNEGLGADLDEDGKPEHPFELLSAYVDREHNRYGVVRDIIDSQDEVNKRRSKALHLLTMRQVSAERGAVADVSEAKRELAKPDGYIEREPGFAFEVLNTSDLASGQAMLLQEAKSEIERMGPSPALQGKADQDQSGRAILAQQRGGMVELGGLMDNLRQFDLRVYRRIWRRIQQSWTAEKWIRVTDDDGAPQFVGMNAQIFDEYGRFLGIQNPVAEMDVDIIIEDAPDVVTPEGEQFAEFMQLLPLMAQMPPPIVKLAVEMAPNLTPKRKAKMLEIIDQMGGAADPQAQAIQAQQAQMAMQKAQGEIENTAADTAKKRADAVKTATEAASAGAALMGPTAYA